MNWNSIRGTWDALRGRVSAHWCQPGVDVPEQSRSSHRYLRSRCDISRREAGRCRKDWMRDPGVLDDWNDTRSILDM